MKYLFIDEDGTASQGDKITQEDLICVDEGVLEIYRFDAEFESAQVAEVENEAEGEDVEAVYEIVGWGRV